jgi:Ku protein
LHQIHAGCGRRISLRKICPEHGTLESSDIRKAFAYSPDLLVEISDDEFAQLEPADDKTIVIERFFAPGLLDPTLFAGRSLFLAPANPAAQPAFNLLKAALDEKHAWALGRTVFSQKRQLVVVHSRSEMVLLHTLHDPALRRLPVTCQSRGGSPSRKELQKLTTAMDECDVPIIWMDYCDDFHRQLAALVAAKVTAQSSSRSGRSKKMRSAKPTRVNAKAA